MTKKQDQKIKLKREIADLEDRLAEMEERLPAHSVPPAMLMEIEELEERLAEIRAKLRRIVQGTVTE